MYRDLSLTNKFFFQKTMTSIIMFYRISDRGLYFPVSITKNALEKKKKALHLLSSVEDCNAVATVIVQPGATLHLGPTAKWNFCFKLQVFTADISASQQVLFCTARYSG